MEIKEDVGWNSLTEKEKEQCNCMMENICDACDDWKNKKINVLEALKKMGENAQQVADIVTKNHGGELNSKTSE